MGLTTVSENVYWVGAVDWNIRWFHGYTYYTRRGTTYNAYLIRDEKVALVDTVYIPFAGELLDSIRKVVSLSDLDYLVINHIELDHAGSLAEVLKAAPQARVYCSPKAAEGLRKYFPECRELNLVKTGDSLSLGRYSLRFIEAPMLHWPDSMFTYLEEQEMLLPNDAFGQHLASTARFDDQVDGAILMDEAARYYANILWPFSSLVLKKMAELEQMAIPVKIIAPSHGVIWRGNPGAILDAYRRWASGEAGPLAVVAYDSMWGSTEKMAHAILEGLVAGGAEAKLFKIPLSDRNDIIKELLDARVLLVGSSTVNNGYLPTVAALLDDLVGLRPVNKIGVAFGSYGWGGGAVKRIEEKLREARFEVAEPGLGIKGAPAEGEIEACLALGKRVAERISALK